MKTMILGLFGVSLAATLSELLLPGDDGRSLKQVLRIVTSLAVLLLIMTPLVSLLKSDHSVALEGLAGDTDAALTEQYNAVFAETVTAGSATLLCDGISDFLSDTYGIDAAHAQVRAAFTKEGNLQAVYITLSGSALLQNPDEISEALSKKLNCTVEVR